jgi:hypothetical protein
MRTYKEACDILGISDGADKDLIKKSYHKLALKHHPDKGGDAEKFREISEAYKMLIESNGENVKYEDEDWENFDPWYSLKSSLVITTCLLWCRITACLITFLKVLIYSEHCFLTLEAL